MKMFNFAAVFMAAFVLSACAGAVPWNDQNAAGVTKAEVTWSPEGKLQKARIIDGKEKEDVKLSVKLPSGAEVKYSASGVMAFDGQEVRAKVEAAVSDDVRAVAPDIVDTIVTAIVPGAGASP